MDELRRLIREIPDFPKPGILFYDITTLLKDSRGLKLAVNRMSEALANQPIDVIIGVEARGFIFAPPLAYQLGAGFVPVRKPKKLPGEVERIRYDLEYGSDTLEIHRDAIQPGQRVVIADDLLATGGTAAATAALVEKLGGEVVGLTFLVELTFLGGREKLARYPVTSLLTYDR
ncbi:adenine phosphoribosyltransferase [Chloracidobacterium sp. MS 40/45]|uniref:adenine phosphoribosyltransferase n=1 Tax=Chloracidobacterium aggregatum TaxID=2851959 RepID=UPI001B8AF72B|nr:adenine phosphoribosyltransferase [Chloracidobacterium aggregatum]QUW01165.1 adenine phosphoribosyltransferase [Chloracidobacterium sp. MS 40/45]